MQPLGHDPHWYDHGPGSEEWKRKRRQEEEAWQAHQQREEQTRRDRLVEMDTEIVSLTAEVERLKGEHRVLRSVAEHGEWPEGGRLFGTASKEAKLAEAAIIGLWTQLADAKAEARKAALLEAAEVVHPMGLRPLVPDSPECLVHMAMVAMSSKLTHMAGAATPPKTDETGPGDEEEGQ